MRISFGQNLSQRQTQKLAPRMIQSMEILQMAQAVLDEKIEQELIENPALERTDESSFPEDQPSNTLDTEKEQKDVEEKELVVDEDQGGEDDFERLLNLDKDIPDHFDESTRPSSNRIQESGDRHNSRARVSHSRPCATWPSSLRISPRSNAMRQLMRTARSRALVAWTNP